MLDFVFVGSVSVPGYDLVTLSRTRYPSIIDDYRTSFERLEKIRADVFLAAHGSFFGLQEKIAKRGASSSNPFIDATAFPAFVARSRSTFERTLSEQQAKAAR